MDDMLKVCTAVKGSLERDAMDRQSQIEKGKMGWVIKDKEKDKDKGKDKGKHKDKDTQSQIEEGKMGWIIKRKENEWAADQKYLTVLPQVCWLMRLV